ncbi:MAG: DEAD/DEAH box helicase [Anaerolineae bacterium]
MNPSYAFGHWIDELADLGQIHPLCKDIFRIKRDDGTSKALRMYVHQEEAIQAANAGDSYVLTTGTGSGKSLAYIIPIVNHVLRRGSGKGIQALVVYPMNALANSQVGELEKYLQQGFDRPPVTFMRYTGQEDEAERADILQNPPDILLTNYVMLELILTRVRERPLIASMHGLKFLVLDELHTYRGRQGADVALLVRRLRDYAEAKNIQCVGTSATLADTSSTADPREGVARVASQLFGVTVKPDRVFTETLRRQSPKPNEGEEFVRSLRSRLGASAPVERSYLQFLSDPLTQWIESTFGLSEDRAGKLVRARPQPVSGQAGASAKLADLTGVDVEACATALRQQLLAGYQTLDPETELPVLAFRVNQFISRGDTAYASLDDPETRHVTTEGQVFVPGDRARILLPLVFCRECGQEFYAVTRKAVADGTGFRYVARDLQSTRPESLEEEHGYLYSEPDSPWLESELDLDLLPSDWIDEQSATRRVTRSRRDRVPVLVHVNNGGYENPEGAPYRYVGKRFDFCPNCGVAYDARQRDYAKLASLDAGGRSSATTTLGLSVIRAMDQEETPRQARKLLSFTDNRQDAALQSGHLNDFVEVGLLRGAVFRAAQTAGLQGLRHEDLPQAVFVALDLSFDRYASNAEVRYLARAETERALRSVLSYRVYHDLRRGWRINSPNLEQSGLLVIEYESLDELCADEDIWHAKHAALVSATPETRKAICTALLDHLRRSLAIDEPALMSEEQERIRLLSQSRLAGPWALDEEEKLETAARAFPRSKRDADYGGNLFVSDRSGFGLHLRRRDTFPDYSDTISSTETVTIIKQIFRALLVAGLVRIVDEEDAEAPGYQACAGTFIWKAGDGTVAFRDPIRVPHGSSEGASTNPYFVDVYRNRSRELSNVTAAEHTAQVHSQVREEREGQFRSGSLPILFCSPTMELGIDIAQLNVVNMRNVPPSPANYAQRGGRAGRSGQPALVYTYCTRGSPHDQYYFRHAVDMVAGAVAPPHLDLANEDLVLAHLDAVWLSETRASLHHSLCDLLDVLGPEPSLELLESVRADLSSESAKQRAAQRFTRILTTFGPELADAAWYDDGWLSRNLANIVQRFDAACDRWRSLYRAAQKQAQVQHAIIQDASRSASDKAQARRLRAEAEQQQALLTSDSGDAIFQSDFYSYRYFASEGFLPGYSFPRLPLSAYIPARRGRIGRDEFLSRPRFLAISEFGPRSIIYHEGSRYIVNRVILPISEGEDSTLTRRAKICAACGYLHPLAGSSDGQDKCENCGADLPVGISGMLRMQNVSTKRRDRINCDEEERTRMGYDLVSTVRYAQKGGRDIVQRAAAKSDDGEVLLSLSYGHAATIWRINRGWRRRQKDSPLGFVLDMERGYWQRNQDDEGDTDDPLSPRTERVIPYVEDRRNCLLITFPDSQPLEVMASLEPALQAGIQLLYQVEQDELAAEPLPDANNRAVIMLYEAAEGGAGVLKQLVDDPTALPRVARAALEICHFDPDTGTDVGRQGDNPCEAACYDCLMSYYNQRDHELLDRHLIRDLLKQLAQATVEISPGGDCREETVRKLRAVCESDLERQWLQLVNQKQLRLPDEAQVNIDQCYVRPDFFYGQDRVAIFVDGPDHGWPEQVQRDRDAEQRLMDAGITWIRFPLPISGWEAILRENEYLFGRMD